jgi:hypothetical protein
MSQLKVPIIAHPFSASTYSPMECLNLDFVGPFPNKVYILSIVDTFSRWIELHCNPDATAASTAFVYYNILVVLVLQPSFVVIEVLTL